MNLIDLVKGNLSDALISQAAGFLGESSQATQNGMNAAIPSILGGILNASGDNNTMGKIWDLLNHKDNDPGILGNLGGLFGGNSPLSSSGGIGSTLLNLVLGNNQSGLLSVLASVAGFKNSGSAGKLLSIAAPFLMGFLKKKIMGDNLSSGGFASWLGGHKNDIMGAIPSGLNSALGFSNLSSGGSRMSSSSTMGNDDNGGNNWWMWLLGLLAALGLLWFMMKGCNKSSMGEQVKTTMDNAAAAVDSAAIKAEMAAKEAAAAAAAAMDKMYAGLDSITKAKWMALGDLMKLNLPGGASIDVPKNGVENALVSWIADTSKLVDKTTWFNFDRILFETNKSTLNAASMSQIENIVAVLNAFPNVNIKIGGYTDNVGNAAKNKTLSAERAKAVMDAVIAKGIAAARLASEGYGPEHPVADNGTEAGREQNRRVAIRVTKK